MFTFSTAVAFTIGLCIGWQFPQPQIVTSFYAWVREKVKGSK